MTRQHLQRERRRGGEGRREERGSIPSSLPFDLPREDVPKSYSFSLSISPFYPFSGGDGGEKFSRPSLFVDNTTELRCTQGKKVGRLYSTTRVCYVRSTPPARRQEDRGDSAECLGVVQSTQYPSPLFSPERMRGKTMCVLCRCVGLSQDG